MSGSYECSKCGGIIGTSPYTAPEDRCTCAPKVGDVRWASLEGPPQIITSVTPVLTPYRRAGQNTKIEGYTLGVREMTKDETVRWVIHPDVLDVQ